MSARILRRVLLAGAILAAVVPASASADLPLSGSGDPVLNYYDATASAAAQNGWTAAGNQQILASRLWATGWGAADKAIAGLPKSLKGAQLLAAQQAALISAVHLTLVSFSAPQRADFSRLRKTSLARIPDGPGKKAGLAAGHAAAKAAIASRAADGIDIGAINAPFATPAPGLGVWQPTLPAFAPAVQAGQGKARPFLIPDVAAKFQADPPPAIDSPTDIADLQEIERVGSATSTERTPEQTFVARFWSQTSVAGYTSVLRSLVVGAKKPVADRVHLVGIFHEVTTDAQIAIYASKYVYLRWRPVTALRTDDKNPATPLDTKFTPLIATPAHPEYPSGHAGYAGAAEEVLRSLLGAKPAAQITAGSTATPDNYRIYTEWSQITQDNIDARVWEGIHLRSTDVYSAGYGKKIATAALSAAGVTPAP